MGVYAWETNLVSCPALSGTTQDYYIYADYTASGTYSLVGATVPGQIKWRDWGLFLNGTGTGVGTVGYKSPPAAAVPATAPGAAQNQEYVGTITNVSGTTFTVTPTIPQASPGRTSITTTASLSRQHPMQLAGRELESSTSPAQRQFLRRPVTSSTLRST